MNRDLQAHLKTHTHQHECPVCNKMLKSKLALESHIKVIHEGRDNGRVQKNYLCVTCGKLCRNKTVYTTHMNKAHLNVKPFDCPVCGMEFFAKSNLKQHEKTHSDKYVQYHKIFNNNSIKLSCTCTPNVSMMLKHLNHQN